MRGTVVRRSMAAILAGALVVASCSSDDDASTDDDASVASSTTAASSAEATTVAPATSAAPGATTTTTAPPPPPSDADGITIEVDGPRDGSFATAAVQDLDQLGYTEAEYVFSGTARSYTGEGFGADGVWNAELDGEAPYTSRVIVRRPADPADFSGVVVVEWFNVTAGFDGDPDWGYLHVELTREGHGYVGVSAQQTGVDALVGQSDGRYGELDHPGDEFSYDIFAQAGVVARGPGDAVALDVWDGLEPTHVIGVGESQSSFRLTSYANAVQPRSPDVYDGLFVHSRGGGATPLTAEGDELDGVDGVRIRTDLTVPVFTFQTETDVGPSLGSASARQDDTDLLRLWEVAGTAHADAYLLREVYGLPEGPGIGASLNCDLPVNDGPQFEVISAAFHHLVAWVVDGTEPPTGTRIDTTGDDPAEIVRDDDGIATGGIRTPAVDVPIAVLSGEGQEGGGFCGLFGTTLAFDEAELASRYGTPDDYVAAVTESARAAADAGHLLEPEVASIIATAETIEF